MKKLLSLILCLGLATFAFGNTVQSSDQQYRLEINGTGQAIHNMRLVDANGNTGSPGQLGGTTAFTFAVLTTGQAQYLTPSAGAFFLIGVTDLNNIYYVCTGPDSNTVTGSYALQLGGGYPPETILDSSFFFKTGTWFKWLSVSGTAKLLGDEHY